MFSVVLGPGQAQLQLHAPLVQLVLGLLSFQPRQALHAFSALLVCGQAVLRPPLQEPVINAFPELSLPTLKQHQCRLVSTVLLEDGLVLVLERAHLVLLEPILLRPVPHPFRLA